MIHNDPQYTLDRKSAARATGSSYTHKQQSLLPLLLHSKRRKMLELGH